MSYRVVVTPEAQAAIDDDLGFIRLSASDEVAERWFTGLIAVIASLSTMPTRCALIPESPWCGEEIRQILYGRKQHRRRIIFVIRGDTVHVVHYRHCSRHLRT